ncbi:MAG: Do family serine endopeptidase [Deltaproteobacteria bacterium]|nr:Do family serine endopeptidase [Deltaproteobacteria bacterium]
MKYKKWMPAFLFIAVSLFLVIASCKVEFPQKAESTKKPLWTEKQEETSSLEKSAHVSEFLHLFKNLTKNLEPAVVNIYTTTTVKQQFISPWDFFGDFFNNDDFFGVPRTPRQDRERQPRFKEFKQKSLGSGFVINEEGYIITNNHVVSEADEIKVRLVKDNGEKDDKEYDAKVIGKDEQTDIALIKIEPKKKLHFLPLGDSDKLEKGEWVLAIGNPFGFSHTVTAGIVSSKGRILDDQGIQHPYNTFIQTDAAINPGNSGGPLINTHGEVVGINTAILRNAQSIGFATPINIAKDLLPQLQEGKVIRGWLGVGIQEITDEMRKKFNIPENQDGVVVTQIFEGDPADKAGIKAWDIIVEVNDHKIKTTRDLIRLVGSLGTNITVNVKVLRDGKLKTFKVVTEERKDERLAQKSESKKTENLVGISVAQITKQLANELELPKSEGVVITAIESGSPAEAANLQKKDIILDIDKKEVRTVKDVEKMVSQFKEGETYFFRVQRGLYTKFLTTVQIPKKND